MAHLKTIGGRTYLYDSIRKNGRVVSRSRGHATAATIESFQLMARLDAIEREAEREREREELAALVDPLLDADRAAETEARAMRTMLESAGYHKPGRGPWRRKRMEVVIVSGPGAKEKFPRLTGAADHREDAGVTGEFFAVNNYAAWCIGKGEEGDTPERQQGRFRLEEACLAEIDARAADLAGPRPSAIVKRLATHAARCEFDLGTVDYLRQIHRPSAMFGTKALTLDKMYSRSQARYLASLKALAQIKHLDATSGPKRTRTVEMKVRETQTQAMGETIFGTMFGPAQPAALASPPADHLVMCG